MLSPEDRHLLLDALRPPAGYTLDTAVGTTFSLDLLALLTAPLAFALFDAEAEDGQPDPIALLEAVRRHAANIDIFCQAGQIALPGQFERVLAYIEGSVHEVTPPASSSRVFHPKVWVIRYASNNDRRYRLLCLSRNLTFDRSWDTVLLLEGVPTASGQRVQANQPLASFLRTLPQLAVHSLAPARRNEITALARDVERTEFTPPAPFDSIAFWPLGVRARRANPIPAESVRLVVSPFLGLDLLNRFGGHSEEETTLVSRAESLDALPASALTPFQLFTLSGDALGPSLDDDESTAADETAAERAGSALRGLHAKLYVTEAGHRASVWTGSANATSAAFGGNVEFLVELSGSQASCGVEALVGGEGVTFKRLLEPYTPPGKPVEATRQELLEQRLDVIRHGLASAQFTASVEPTSEDETFELRLSAEGAEPDALSEATGVVWPISRSDARRPLGDVFAAGANFGQVSLERLTSFFGIELKLRERQVTATAQFVVNANLVGTPTNREDILLWRLLESRDKVLRYLLLLLADDGVAGDGGGAITRLLAAIDGSGGWNDPWSIPLLESMVRALARNPDRLDQVARLIDTLRSTDEGAALLPEGLDEIWPPIWQAREERAKR